MNVIAAPFRAIDLAAEAPFRVGQATIDPVTRQATYDGESEHLQPQNLKVLVALASARGKVVTRDQLTALCWDGRVIGDDVINRAISTLRQFAKRAGGFEIETFPRAGYLLVELKPHSLDASRSLVILAGAILAGLALALSLSLFSQTASIQAIRIAVLPFRASGGVDPALAEAMAEDVLGNLSRQNGLATVGRTSSWVFKDKAEDLRRVGHKLDVRFVVEGSARREKRGLLLNVALIDTRDASTSWSGRFISPSGDTQLLEDAATAGIVKRLRPQDVIANRHADPQAYALYLRAKALIRERDRAKMEEARELLQLAVKRDPKFAPAWAQLSGALTFLDQDSGGSGDTHAEALAAARQSIALDPNLAEGHQMFALALNWDNPQSLAHIRRALKLDPNNVQALFWLGQIASYSGNNSLQEKIVQRAYSLDPLWARPTLFAALYAQQEGRTDDASRYISRLRRSDPHGAVEVEMALALERGDLSRVVELGRSPANVSAVNASQARMSLASALLQMGYLNEAMLIAEVRPFERSAHLRRLQDRQSILRATKEFVGKSSEVAWLVPVIFELARTGRYNDIVALYDRPGSSFSRLGNIEDGNRWRRSCMAGPMGDALARSGREREAARLFRAADEASRRMLANGKLFSSQPLCIAIAEGSMGRKTQALRVLEQAVRKGWLNFDEVNLKLDEIPWFESLKEDPRFERLRLATDARLTEERRETEALGLL